MTITMFDSIDPSTLPAGAGFAYAGYIDGRWPDYQVIKNRFPHSHVLSITIAENTAADCIDVESLDATVQQGARWLIRKIEMGSWRPVVYASVSVMGPIVAAVQAIHHEDLSAIRLWTAHYKAGRHICGPATCGQLSVAADGTQWTSTSGGISLDESILLDSFFSGTSPLPSPSPVPTWETKMMNSLPTLNPGAKDSGQPWVRRVQGLCLAELSSSVISVDGDFGTETEAAVKTIQASHHVTVDGIVGPVTWRILVTGTP